MKKILLMMVMLFSISLVTSAQTYYYRTTSFAIKEKPYGNWSDWEASNILITINYNTDIVRIYSPKTQVYKITQWIRNYIDENGGRQVEFKFIDQDGDRGHMRLRIERNGNSQLYVEFADIMWVYNLYRTN